MKFSHDESLFVTNIVLKNIKICFNNDIHKKRGIDMDEALKENYLGALENVIDPELGIDIVNLGLIYDVDMDEEGLCTVTMTLTSMGCPLAGHIEADVRRALADFPEIKEIQVDIVWDPPWGKDKMSRYAKIALGIPD